MAKTITTPRVRFRSRVLAEQIKSALKDGLKVSGITAKVFVEPVPKTKLMRVSVVSSNFAPLRFSERQDLVWRIVSEAFNYEQQLHISMIQTLTPHELIGK